MTGKNEFNSMVYQGVTEVLESNVGTLVVFTTFQILVILVQSRVGSKANVSMLMDPRLRLAK